MLSVFICEDDPKYLKSITKCVSNYIMMEELDMKIKYSTTSPIGLLNYLDENKQAGLYFLDIDLSCKINGIKLADNIRKHDPRGFIVFITADAESHMLTFQYKIEAMDYIVKGDKNLKTRIGECIHSAYSKYTSKVTNPLQNNLVFDLPRGHTLAVEAAKILYITTDPSKPHNIILYTNDSKHQFRGTLTQTEKMIAKSHSSESFIRCHRSHIVNVKKLVALDTENLKITLVDDVNLDVADKYVRKVKTVMSKQ